MILIPGGTYGKVTKFDRKDDPLLDVSLAELRATHGLSEGLETGFPEKLAHCHRKGGASA